MGANLHPPHAIPLEMAERAGAAAGPGADAVEREALGRLAPSPELRQRVESACSRLVARAESVAAERRIPVVRCLVAGSAARGTYLADRLDIDLFLLFPPETSREQLVQWGLDLAREVLTDPSTRYAEHPYLRGQFEGFAVDAVPGFAVRDPAHPQSAVDRTPFHQAYLTSRYTPELVDQVRLAKQFLRSIGVYGSESRTAGFSGYLIELLVLRFGGFRGLLAAARGWRPPVRLESTPGAKPAVPDDVALILDDPVDPARNVSSALSRRNLSRFVLAAAEYLEHPAARAFEVRPSTPPTLARALEKVRDRATHVSVLALPRPALVDDILYPQMRKAERALSEEAERLGFAVLGTASAAGPDRVVVLLEVEHGVRPVVRVQDGPPPGLDRVASFLEKWEAEGAPVLQGPYVTADGRLAVETRRAERTVEALLGAAFDHLPLGRDLKPRDPQAASFRPLDEVGETEALDAALGELLDKRLPWR